MTVTAPLTRTRLTPFSYRGSARPSFMRESVAEYRASHMAVATAPAISSEVRQQRADESVSDSAHDSVPDAVRVHDLLKSLHACGNEIRLAFIEALRTLHDGSLCYELGYASFHQYCDRELGIARSSAYEYLRAAEALDSLPQLRRHFRQGELSWAQVRAITRVATAETECRWIEFAWREPVRDLMAEVREAQRTGRDAPREKRHGLPNLLVDLGIKVTLEEKARIETAFALVGEAMEPSSGGDESASADPRPALVRWADGVLAGAIPVRPVAVSVGAIPVGPDGRPIEAIPARPNGVPAEANPVRPSGVPAGAISVRPKAAPTGRTPLRLDGVSAETAPVDGATPRRGAGVAAPHPTPAQTIVYHMCPACRESTVETADGRVSVAPQRVVELAPFANRVEIPREEELHVEPLPEGQVDTPNTARLARQVVHRDGLRCANPGCDRRRDLHAHHLVFRADGGRTVLSNEVAVCGTCHAMIHAGLLEVGGSIDEGLEWTPRPASLAAKVRTADTLRARARELESVTAEQVHRSGTGREFFPASHGTFPRAAAESPPETFVHPERERELADALRSWGFTRSESRERVRRAVLSLLTEASSAAGEVHATPKPPSDEDILRRAFSGRAEPARSTA